MKLTTTASLAALLSVCSLALAACGNGGDESADANGVNETAPAENASETTQETGGATAMDDVREDAAAARDAAADLAQSAANAVGEATENARTRAGELASSAAEAAGDAGEELKSAAGRLAEAASNAGSEAAAWMEKHANLDGVNVLDNGTQYIVIEEGSGESPDGDDVVTVHYTGRLLDGTVFDSSRERGQPATFPLNQVIPCWTEGVQLMKPGARYQLFCPADQAYGARGAAPVIPPNAPLIFDVELIEVGAPENGNGGDAP